MVKIQMRRDTAANWVSGNPALAAGEHGFETDTGREKIGDGSTAWNSLEYIDDLVRNARSGVNQNAIINGNFDVWQRGTSFSSPANGAFSADRWRLTYNGASGVTCSQQSFVVGQTDVPNEPSYYHRDVFTTGSSNSEYYIRQQPIESVKTAAGQSVTLSMWAKADAVKYAYVELVQSFGTGGSSDNVVSGSKVQLTSSWQKFSIQFDVPSISGKTIGVSSSLSSFIWFTGGSDFNSRTDSIGNQSGTFDIAQVQLYVGDKALPYQPRSYADELRLCQRYYQELRTIEGFASGTGNFVCGSPLPVTMRTAPTVTATAPIVITTTSADFTQSSANITSVNATNNGFHASFGNFTGLTAGDGYIMHGAAAHTGNQIVLDAEL